MHRNETDILYVITDLELGGVPLHLHRLVGAMRARGLTVSVVSLAPPGPVSRMLEEDGVDVRSCDGCCGWDLRVIGRLARIIRSQRPNIVHSLLFHANVAARWAAEAADLPDDRVLCEIQTVEVERKWHLWVDRWTHGGCRFTIGNSPSVIEHLSSAAGIPRGRLKLVRGGIDPAPIRNAQTVDRSSLECDLEADSPIVLWVGRLDPVKGLAILIRAFRDVAAATDARLLLAGDGPIRSELKRLIQDEGLSRRVYLLGPCRDVAGLLKTADVFVFPSRTEGLPNALLEAMAAGCPIVTTDVPGCRDLIEDGDTGLVVRFGDTNGLSASIRLLLTDRELAERLGNRASNVVEREWHIDRTHDAYCALYDSIRAGLTRSS